MLGDHSLGAALVEVGDDGVAVERLVADQGVELQALDKRRDADGVVAVAGKKDEADQIAECIGEGQDLRGPAALRLAYGLGLSSPFAPCPWR